MRLVCSMCFEKFQSAASPQLLRFGSAHARAPLSFLARRRGLFSRIVSLQPSLPQQPYQKIEHRLNYRQKYSAFVHSRHPAQQAAQVAHLSNRNASPNRLSLPQTGPSPACLASLQRRTCLSPRQYSFALVSYSFHLASE